MSDLNVSIIIPAYNAEKYISQTIQSVINQTAGSWELIIVDDCSTDRTNEIIQKFASKDKRIHLVRHDVNKGVSEARNTGICHSKSKWLVFLDADDLLLPAYLENMFQEIGNGQDIDCVHCGWNRLGRCGEGDFYDSCEDLEKLFPVFARKNGFSTVSACMITKKITESVHGFDAYFKRCADWDFWQKIARKSVCFKSIKKPLVNYRMAENSLTSNILLVTEFGLSIIERGHSYDMRISDADKEFIYGMPRNQLSSAKLNWILWPCAFLIGQGQDPDLALKLVKNCSDPGIQPEYIAGVFYSTVMVAQGKGADGWRESWPHYESKINEFFGKLENQSELTGLAKNTYSILRNKIFQN